jgi:hypothetical protein
MEKNQPAYTDRRGRLSLTIWKNETTSGTRYSSEITRSWKDDDEYESTYRLDERDLLAAAKLAHIADDWISEQRRNQKTKSPEG